MGTRWCAICTPARERTPDMAKKKSPPDDGHTIVSMRALDVRHEESGGAPANPGAPASARETRWILFASLKAALLLALVFSLAMIAFVALLLLAWR